jgi:hypothetical protein
MKRLIMLGIFAILVLGSQAIAQVPRTVLAEHLTATW